MWTSKIVLIHTLLSHVAALDTKNPAARSEDPIAQFVHEIFGDGPRFLHQEESKASGESDVDKISG